MGGSAIAASYFGGDTVHGYVDKAIDGPAGIGTFITIHDGVVQALKYSHALVQLNLAGGIRQGQIASQVVQAMDPALHAEVLRASHGFDTFTKNYTGKDRSRFADVAMRSRDPFTRERNWTLTEPDLLWRKNVALKKRGGTDLIGLDEWRAIDTLELHGRVLKCHSGFFHVVPSFCDDVGDPIGWGGIEVDAGGGDTGHGYHGSAYGENGHSAALSDSVMRQPSYAAFSGMPESRDLSDTDPSHDASTAITIRVTKSQSNTLTSGNAAQARPAGRLDLFDSHPAAGDLAALARAQVFFDRLAARYDRKSEIGSLYNPYWRVRLIAPTAADRAYAATKQNNLVLP